MIIIKLWKTPSDEYVPLTMSDQELMQHLINEDLVMLNEQGLKKAQTVAKAHNWKIKIV